MSIKTDSDDIDEGLQNIIDNTSFDLHSDLITIYEDDGNTSNSSKDLETSRSSEKNSEKKNKFHLFKSLWTPRPTPGKRGATKRNILFTNHIVII